MKIFLLTFTVALLAAVSTFGQNGPAAPTISNAESAKVSPKSVVREKFDPLRDPKPDLQKAVEQASKAGKRIILDVGGEWCSWCLYMDRFFVQNPALAKIRDDNYVWVKVNYSEENENKDFLAAYPAASGYPHLYVLDETGKLLQSQDTSVLEAGKGYDLPKFTEFLKTWSPKKALVVTP